MYDLRARIWRDWGFAALALGDAHRAVHHAPNAAGPLNTLGTVLQALGRHDEARRAYEQAVDLDPSAAYALNNLCYLFVVQGNAGAGQAACRQALALEPALAVARNNLALAHVIAGRLDEAEREFRAASGPAAASYNLGMVYMAGGDFKRARDAFHASARMSASPLAAHERARQAGDLLYTLEARSRQKAFDHEPD
jgi:Flp pilus assembly protein TadD